jgi:hypothetical protein
MYVSERIAVHSSTRRARVQRRRAGVLVVGMVGAMLLNGCENFVTPRTSIGPPLRADVLATDTWPGVFDPFTVLSLHLEIAASDWDIVRKDVSNSIEKPAQFYADGETPIAVTVRRKSSRALPSEANPVKVGLKVKTVTGRWHGVTTLSLENGGDISPIAEGLAWNLHEMASIDGFYGAGYHPALAAWVRVHINGDYIGLYSNVEQRNKQFLRNRFGTTSGIWLYEVDDIDSWELEAGDPHSPAFLALCFSPFQPVTKGKGTAGCPKPSDAQLETALNQHIDMRAMLVQGAIDAFADNPDALFSHGKNFSFADFATETPRRQYFPWDMDAVFRKTDGNIYASSAGRNKFTQSPYQSVILNHPAFRQQYNEIMLALVDASGPLSEEKLHAFIDGVQVAVQDALNEDPYIGGSGSGPFSALKSWISQRIPAVKAQVQKNVPAPRL